MNKQLMEKFLARRRKMLKEAAEEKLTMEDIDDFFAARDKQVRKRIKLEIKYGDYGDYDMWDAIEDELYEYNPKDFTPETRKYFKKRIWQIIDEYEGTNYAETELDEGCKSAARRRKMLKEATNLYDKINNYLIKIGEEPLDATDDIEEDFSMEDDILNEAKADISLEKETLGKKGIKQLLAPYKRDLKDIFNRWYKYGGDDFAGPIVRYNILEDSFGLDLLEVYILRLLADATKTDIETVCNALNEEGLNYIIDLTGEKTVKLFGSSYGSSPFPKTSQITQEVIEEVEKLARELCDGDLALQNEFLRKWKNHIKNYRKNNMADDHKRRAAKLPEEDPLLEESFKRIKKPANLLESLNRGFEQIYGNLDDNRRLTEAKEAKKKYPIKEFFADHMDELNKIMNNKKSSEKQKKQEILDLLNSSDVSKAQIDQFARKMEATHDWGFYGFIGTYITAQKVNECVNKKKKLNEGKILKNAEYFHYYYGTKTDLPPDEDDEDSEDNGYLSIYELEPYVEVYPDGSHHFVEVDEIDSYSVTDFDEAVKVAEESNVPAYIVWITDDDEEIPWEPIYINSLAEKLPKKKVR